MMIDVRDNLKEIINDGSYVKANIANKAGLTPSQLSKILSKKRKMDTIEMYQLCLVLGISPDQLYRYNSL